MGTWKGKVKSRGAGVETILFNIPVSQIWKLWLGEGEAANYLA